jgi:hypothetical protein
MIIYPNSTSLFPLDRCRIATKVELNADFVEDPAAMAPELGIDWYDLGRGHDKKGASYKERSATIDLSQYGVLFLMCYKPEGGKWSITSIKINPVKLLYGQNARRAVEAVEA